MLLFVEGCSGFSDGNGAGFSEEWPEGLSSCGEEYQYFIKEKKCNIVGIKGVLFIKEWWKLCQRSGEKHFGQRSV